MFSDVTVLILAILFPPIAFLHGYAIGYGYAGMSKLDALQRGIKHAKGAVLFVGILILLRHCNGYAV